MTARGWVTVALVFVLLALGIGAYRSSPAGASGSGAARPAAERVVDGEETPRIWREVQRSRVPK
jgi:hypothetical protein